MLDSALFPRALDTHLIVLLDLSHPGPDGVTKEIVRAESVDVHVSVGEGEGQRRASDEMDGTTDRHIETS